MHELSVVENLLGLALKYADGAPVTDLYIVIGQLSSFVDESVQFYWDIVSEGTPAAGSRLHFRRIPAEMQCADCGQQYRLREDQFACPNCGGANVRLLCGNEFYLDAVEVKPVEGISS
jgi:hydrogenase nickel incorporation protein HypA/HybF